jgi:iron complex transport system substrate-binding protein
VVSLNLCTDQWLLLLADPAQVAGVSHLAADPEHSYMAREAGRHPALYPRIEPILGRRPDLVLGASYTSPPLVGLLRRLGVRVELLPLGEDLDGIRAGVRRLAALLGRGARGESLLAEMDRRLAAIPPPELPRPRGLFIQPNGYSAGLGTLQDLSLRLAGWRNAAAEAGLEGYGPLTLETLVSLRPDRFIVSPFHDHTDSLAQRQLRHPALVATRGGRPFLELPYNLWICGGPMLAEAVERLAGARRP